MRHLLPRLRALSLLLLAVFSGPGLAVAEGLAHHRAARIPHEHRVHFEGQGELNHADHCLAGAFLEAGRCAPPVPDVLRSAQVHCEPVRVASPAVPAPAGRLLPPSRGPPAVA